jgi:hypothetical protein
MDRIQLASQPICPMGESPSRYNPKPGDWWFAPWLLEHGSATSTQYQRDWLGKRPPIVVATPNGRGGTHDWSIDRPMSEETIPAGPDGRKDLSHGWTVTGELPRISATPSIGVYGDRPGWTWHAWLKDGVLEQIP